jgi:signal transduction histidine kinase
VPSGTRGNFRVPPVAGRRGRVILEVEGGIAREGDAVVSAGAYARKVDTGVVRRVVTTSRPADWLMAASLLVLAWFEIWVEPIFQTGMPGPRIQLTLLCVLALLPLLARRVLPLPALMVMCLGFVGVGIVGDPDQSTFVLLLGLLVAVYSLAAYDTPRNAVIGAVVVVVAGGAFESMTFVDKVLADVMVPALFVAAAWAVGKQVHHQRQRATELAEHSALLARAQQLEVQAAVAGERTRIARELHDVVAHAISVMGIQAGAARHTLAPGQDAQNEALLDVERLGREALGEMQRMLEVLRTGKDDQGLGPLPDLGRVTALADDARLTGLEVVLDVAPDLHTLPAGVQLTAYRIVQEALTNVRKHTRASSVCVTVARSGDHLDITVADDGNGLVGELAPGNGLIGMRERVAMHDGTLFTGPGDDGGFVVRTRLPVTGRA